MTLFLTAEMEAIWAAITSKVCHVQLTRREKEVLRLYGENKTILQIAEQLFISSHTVNDHLKNSRKKFSVKSSSEAYVIAEKNNML